MIDFVDRELFTKPSSIKSFYYCHERVENVWTISNGRWRSGGSDESGRVELELAQSAGEEAVKGGWSELVAELDRHPELRLKKGLDQCCPCLVHLVFAYFVRTFLLDSMHQPLLQKAKEQEENQQSQRQ